MANERLDRDAMLKKLEAAQHVGTGSAGSGTHHGKRNSDQAKLEQKPDMEVDAPDNNNNDILTMLREMRREHKTAIEKNTNALENLQANIQSTVETCVAK